MKKSKKTRRQIALAIVLAVEEFEIVLEHGELERIAAAANPLELAFLDNLGANLGRLNQMIVARRADRNASPGT